MVAATIVRRVDTFQPGVEEVILTASDGETFATTLSSVDTMITAVNSDDDGAHNAVASGQIITLNLAGMTNETITLRVHGRP